MQVNPLVISLFKSLTATSNSSKGTLKTCVGKFPVDFAASPLERVLVLALKDILHEKEEFRERPLGWCSAVLKPFLPLNLRQKSRSAEWTTSILQNSPLCDWSLDFAKKIVNRQMGIRIELKEKIIKCRKARISKFGMKVKFISQTENHHTCMPGLAFSRSYDTE